MTEKRRGAFRNWDKPSDPYYSTEKVLDAGCGMRPHQLLGDEVWRELRQGNPQLVCRGKGFLHNVYDIDWKNEFDTAFSIDVIHHLKAPATAYSRLRTDLRIQA